METIIDYYSKGKLFGKGGMTMKHIEKIIEKKITDGEINIFYSEMMMRGYNEVTGRYPHSPINSPV